MYFTSLVFLAFLATFLLLYYILPPRRQLPLLLLANFLFYAYSGLNHLLFLTTTVVTVYFSALKIQKLTDIQKEESKNIQDKAERKAYKASVKNQQKKWLLACFFVNFGILAVLKYTDFVITNINSLSTLWGGKQLDTLNLLLPLGLSFYTFQAISYILDVYWGKQEAQRSFLHYAVYASFFPQMIQGPISRYGKVKESLYAEHKFQGEQFYQAIVRFLYGFFKKLVIADRLMPIYAQLSSNPEENQGIYFLLTIFLYAIALYADFTGGIDITISLAKMCGITLEENFNKPYLSRSIAEYWRRWHMTMGGWFRDYLFYPLSVSKKMLKISSVSRKKLGNNLGKRVPFYLSTLTIWFATGIWHGATWNYILWGITNGVVILISQELKPMYDKFHKTYPNMKENKVFIAFTVFRTFWLMCFIRAFDCYATVPITFQMYGSLFTNFSLAQFLEQGISHLTYEPIQWFSTIYGVVVLLFVGWVTVDNRPFTQHLEEKSILCKTAVLYFLLFSILLLGAYGVGYDSSQFIYNQF